MSALPLLHHLSCDPAFHFHGVCLSLRWILSMRWRWQWCRGGCITAAIGQCISAIGDSVYCSVVFMSRRRCLQVCRACQREDREGAGHIAAHPRIVAEACRVERSAGNCRRPGQKYRTPIRRRRRRRRCCPSEWRPLLATGLGKDLGAADRCTLTG